jgi:hypothetical protein
VAKIKESITIKLINESLKFIHVMENISGIRI